MNKTSFSKTKWMMCAAVGALLTHAALPSAATPVALRADREARAAVPSDTLYATRQWWLGTYDAVTSAGLPDLPRAWDRSTGFPSAGMGPVVAVLDSGITSHPDLDARLVLPGYDFVSDIAYANDSDGRDNDPTDPGDRLTAAERDANRALWDGCAVSARSSWHGTMIAGQIGAVSNNAAGVAGINWNGRILPVRVAGKCGASVADMVDGMRWAGGLPVAGVPANAHPARIIVIGFAGYQPCDLNHPDAQVAAAARLYVDTIAALRAQGVLVIAAAGNQRGPVGRPASCDGVFAVTALNRQGFKTVYANYGTQVALATVGGDVDRGGSCDGLVADTGIVSTSNAGSASPEYGVDKVSYGAGDGTSFAAPIVAGVASLMLSSNPALTLVELEAGLRRSARPHVLAPALGECNAAVNPSRCQCSTSTCGAGVLDASEALVYAANPSNYVAPPRNAVLLETSALRQCSIAMGLPQPPAPPASSASSPTLSSSDSGGGALGASWLIGLGLGTLALLRSRMTSGRA
ncbi:MAG: hypothetical protein RLZZ618_1662 [Pseudomonadota bacterium]|jgi:serine protease